MNIHSARATKRAALALRASALALIAGSTLATGHAYAADVPATAGASPNPGTVEEVVVTAQKRSENLQKVPIAVTAITASSAISKGITQSEDLNIAVPGLNVSRTISTGLFFIRGVGTNSVNPGVEPPVAFYVDGVYYGAAVADISSYNNIDHIEVLKGPQGTLFGRNSTGGLVQVVTKDPSFTPGGRVSIGYGNYNTPYGSLYLTTGFGDKLAGDIALYATDQREGWGKNIHNGQDANFRRDYSARTKWIFTPDPSLKLTLEGDYAYTYSDLGEARQVLPGLPNPLGGAYAGIVNDGDFYDTNSNQPNWTKARNYGASLRIDKDFEAFKVVNILAARKVNRKTLIDLDETPVEVQHAAYDPDVTKTVSEELQILSPDSSPIKWIAGFYYFHDTAGAEPLTLYVSALGPALYQRIYDVQTLNSYAGFAQATVPLFSDATHLTGGVRYSIDDRSIEGTVDTAISHIATVNQSHTWKQPTFRVALDHQFTDDFMGYALVSTGFKSGIYNATTPTTPAVNPEKLTDYEVGFKSELFDHRLRLNGSAFLYEYRDLQFTQFTGASSVLRNAAKAEIYGAELEGDAVLTDEFTASAGLSLLHGTYTSFPNAVSFQTNLLTGLGVSTIIDETGNDVMRTPRTTFNIGFDWHHQTDHGLIGANFTWYYNGGFYFDPDNQYKQDAYSLINGELRWFAPGERWGVRVWGKNLNGAKYYSVIQTANGGPPVGGPGQPRTFGVTLDYNF